MTILHIKIYKIDKAQAKEIIIYPFQSLIHTVNITVDRNFSCNAPVSKNIRNLAYANNRISCYLKHIQYCILWCLQGKIVTAWSTIKLWIGALEWTSDNSAYCMFTTHNASSLTAVFIKLLWWNNILMSRNLQYTVSGSIYDKSTCFHMLLTVIMNNLCTRIRFVANNLSAKSIF